MPELFGDRIGDKHNKGEKEAIKRSMLEWGRGEQLSRGVLFLLSETTAGRVEVRTLEGCNNVRLIQGSQGRGPGPGEVMEGGRRWRFCTSHWGEVQTLRGPVR